MATRKPKAKPTVEDQAQSQRFIDMARELERDGDLRPDGEARFEEALKRAPLPPKPN